MRFVFDLATTVYEKHGEDNKNKSCEIDGKEIYFKDIDGLGNNAKYAKHFLKLLYLLFINDGVIQKDTFAIISRSEKNKGCDKYRTLTSALNAILSMNGFEETPIVYKKGVFTMKNVKQYNLVFKNTEDVDKRVYDENKSEINVVLNFKNNRIIEDFETVLVPRIKLEEPINNEFESLASILISLSQVPKYQKLYLTGIAGSGKTYCMKDAEKKINNRALGREKAIYIPSSAAKEGILAYIVKANSRFGIINGEDNRDVIEKSFVTKVTAEEEKEKLIFEALKEEKRSIYLLIDAIDELSVSERKELIKEVNNIATIGSNIKIVITSKNKYEDNLDGFVFGFFERLDKIHNEKYSNIVVPYELRIPMILKVLRKIYEIEGFDKEIVVNESGGVTYYKIFKLYHSGLLYKNKGETVTRFMYNIVLPYLAYTYIKDTNKDRYGEISRKRLGEDIDFLFISEYKAIFKGYYLHEYLNNSLPVENRIYIEGKDDLSRLFDRTVNNMTDNGDGTYDFFHNEWKYYLASSFILSVATFWNEKKSNEFLLNNLVKIAEETSFSKRKIAGPFFKRLNIQMNDNQRFKLIPFAEHLYNALIESITYDEKRERFYLVRGDVPKEEVSDFLDNLEHVEVGNDVLVLILVIILNCGYNYTAEKSINLLNKLPVKRIIDWYIKTSGSDVGIREEYVYTGINALLYNIMAGGEAEGKEAMFSYIEDTYRGILNVIEGYDNETLELLHIAGIINNNLADLKQLQMSKSLKNYFSENGVFYYRRKSLENRREIIKNALAKSDLTDVTIRPIYLSIAHDLTDIALEEYKEGEEKRNLLLIVSNILLNAALSITPGKEEKKYMEIFDRCIKDQCFEDFLKIEEIKEDCLLNKRSNWESRDHTVFFALARNCFYLKRKETIDYIVKAVDGLYTICMPNGGEPDFDKIGYYNIEINNKVGQLFEEMKDIKQIGNTNEMKTALEKMVILYNYVHPDKQKKVEDIII